MERIISTQTIANYNFNNETYAIRDVIAWRDYDGTIERTIELDSPRGYYPMKHSIAIVDCESTITELLAGFSIMDITTELHNVINRLPVTLTETTANDAFNGMVQYLINAYPYTNPNAQLCCLGANAQGEWW